MRIAVEDLVRFARDAFLKTGMSESDSATAAEALVLTDSWGVHTHGTKNLPGYVRRLLAGGIRPAAKPFILKEGPSWAMADGDGALGTVASTFAMQTAIEKAASSGIAYVGLRNSCHFGAAGVYTNLAAQTGLIGIAMSNDTPTVAIPGSTAPVLGSNPLSYAIPLKDGNPILLDIATSTVAGGKVFAAAAKNEKVPAGWIIDQKGAPTDDPNLFPDRATLTPMSAHKGYGIAFLIETLSAILTGASIAGHVLSWSFSDPTLPTNHGAAFIAINPDLFMDRPQFQQRLKQTIHEIKSAPRIPGLDRLFLPGEMEWDNRDKALIHGIELPPEIAQQLRTLSNQLQIPIPS